MCLFADQNLLSPNLSLVADEFGFDEHERDAKLGGQVALGFFIVGAPAALLAGYFTDICRRTYVFGVMTALSGLACLSTFFVNDYSELLMCRIFTGIGIGTSIPCMYSIMSDLYSVENRIHMSMFVNILMFVGISGGQTIAGFTGPVMGWRFPFLIVGVPAIIGAILVLTTAVEPVRGSQEEAVLQMRKTTHFRTVTTGLIASLSEDDICSRHRSYHSKVDAELPMCHRNTAHNSHGTNYSETIDWSKVLDLLRTPSVAIIITQGIPGCLPWGIVYVYLNDYFSEDRGLSIHEATVLLSMFGVGATIGILIGGSAGQYMYNIDKKYQCYLMGTSTVLSLLPLLVLINCDAREGFSNGSFFLWMILAGITMNITGVNVNVVLQNVTTPGVRGTAFAFHALTDDLGKGGGPAAIALLIRAVGSRTAAFNCSLACVLLCGLLLVILAFYVDADECNVQHQIADSISRDHCEPGNVSSKLKLSAQASDSSLASYRIIPSQDAGNY